jgi:predicted TIM-barrel fold metal-dependent hydrolase
MIVDCHTRIWEPNSSFAPAVRGLVAPPVQPDAAGYLEAVDPVDQAIVLGFRSRYLEAEIPNRFVAEHVRRSAKLVGFAGIDPSDRGWRDELRLAQEELSLKGVLLSPALQGYHPADTLAMPLYEECVRRGLPVVIDQQPHHRAARLEFARPVLLDEVAREFPELRIVISRLGSPWVEEALVLLGKHGHVYADVAGLLHQPWRTYNALLSAYEAGVMEKLLFGSDFPYREPAECIEALYSINQLSHGTNLKAIPREQLRGIVERNALSLLGIEVAAPQPNKSKAGIFADDE